MFLEMNCSDEIVVQNVEEEWKERKNNTLLPVLVFEFLG